MSSREMTYLAASPSISIESFAIGGGGNFQKIIHNEKSVSYKKIPDRRIEINTLKERLITLVYN